MPKRKKRNVRKSRLLHFPKSANVLVFISIFFLVLNSVLLIFLRDGIISALQEAGIEASASSLALMGMLWLMIAFFAWGINRNIKEGLNRISMWELMILSFATMFSGRVESGFIMLMASIIYLFETRERKKRNVKRSWFLYIGFFIILLSVIISIILESLCSFQRGEGQCIMYFVLIVWGVMASLPFFLIDWAIRFFGKKK